jgi:hypothetical protein
MNRVKREAKTRRYVNTPNGRVDLRSGKTLSTDEWFEELNRCNPLDRHATRRRAFQEPDTPLDGLIIFKADRLYHLLNQSGLAVEALTMEAVEIDDMRRVLSSPRAFLISDIPPSSRVALHPAPPEPQRKLVYRLTRVDWAPNDTWTGRKRLPCQTPVTAAQHLHQLPLTEVDRPVESI